MQTNKQTNKTEYCVLCLNIKKEGKKLKKNVHSQKTWFIMLTELAAATTATYDTVKISLRK